MLVHNDYCLSEATMALVSTKHPYYHSIIYDVTGTYLSTQSIASLFEKKGLEQKEFNDFFMNNKISGTYVYSIQEEMYGFQIQVDIKDRIVWIFPKYDTEQTFPRLTFTNGERLIIRCSLDYYKWMKKKLNRLSQLEV